MGRSVKTPPHHEAAMVGADGRPDRVWYTWISGIYEAMIAGLPRVISSTNIAIHSAALQALTTGADNVAIGNNALRVATTGSRNIGVGTNAGIAITTGTDNIFLGYGAGLSTYAGVGNIGIGFEAGEMSGHGGNSYAIFIGYQAGKGSRGGGQIGIGNNALSNSTGGEFNNAIGLEALRYLTTGDYNTVMGWGAAITLTTGSHNTAFGHDTLKECVTGSGNVAIGKEALYETTLSNTVAVGYGAGYSAGSASVFLGYQAGAGSPAGTGSVTRNNTFVLANNGTTDLLYGEFDNNLLFMGKRSSSLATVGLEWAATGLFRATVNNAVIGQINRLNGDGSSLIFYRDGTEVGSISVTTTNTAFNTSSDGRLKEKLRPLDRSGDVIDAIEPLRFDWKYSGGSGVGFIAQDLHKVIPEAVKVGDSDPSLIPGQDGFDQWGVDHSKLVPYLVAEVQALRKRVAELETMRA